VRTTKAPKINPFRLANLYAVCADDGRAVPVLTMLHNHFPRCDELLLHFAIWNITGSRLVYWFIETFQTDPEMIGSVRLEFLQYCADLLRNEDRKLAGQDLKWEAHN